MTLQCNCKNTKHCAIDCTSRILFSFICKCCQPILHTDRSIDAVRIGYEYMFPSNRANFAVLYFSFMLRVTNFKYYDVLGDVVYPDIGIDDIHYLGRT